MSNRRLSLTLAPLFAAATLMALPAAAETLAKPESPHHRASASHASATVPWRGMTMSAVEKRFGAPLARLPDAGGDSPRHPVIHRWRYQGYTVYFERNHVIHSVIDQSAAASKS